MKCGSRIVDFGGRRSRQILQTAQTPPLPVCVILYCALAALSGCGGFGHVTPLSPQPGPGGGGTNRANFSGVVADGTTTLPLQGVDVLFGGNHQRTDANGRFEFSNVGVPRRQGVRLLQTTGAQTAKVALTVALQGYATFFKDDLTVTLGGAPNQLNVSLAPLPGSSTLTGIVEENATGKAVEDVLVTIGGVKGRTFTDAQDNKSKFILSGVVSGRQLLRIEASGFTPTTRTLDVPFDQVQDLGIFKLFKVNEKITVTGTVRDEDGSPVAGAKVEVASASALTDANGFFSVDAPPGTQRFTVTKAGFQDAAREVEVVGGLPPLEFVLLKGDVTPPGPPSNVRGTVTVNGQPVSGVLVRALEQPGNAERDRSTTGADGKFFLFIPPGQYVLRAEGQGLQPVERIITVPPGGQVVQVGEIAMLPAGNPSLRLQRRGAERSRLGSRLR